MIWIILLLAVFVCVSSIFCAPLRPLALCIMSTAVVVIGGLWLLFAIIAK